MINIKYWLPLLLFSISSTSSATPPTLSQKYLNLKTDIQFLNTTENFDKEGGGIEDLDSGNSYKLYNLNVSTFYTFSTDLAFDLGMAFANATSIDAKEERTNTQFTEVHAKLLYQLTEHPVELIPEIALIIPFNRVNEDTDDVLTGEGSLQAMFGTWLVKDFGSFYTYLFAGYNYRDEGRSALLPWKLGAEIDFDGFYLGVEGSGYESMSEDENTDNEIVKTKVTNKVNAGSLNFYSINPQEIAVAGWVGIEFSKFFLTRLQYSQSINGSNTSLNRVFMATFEYRFDMTKNIPKDVGLIDRKSRKRLNNFQVEDEDYDEDLFDKDRQHHHRKIKIKEKKLLNDVERNLDR
ncbi:MAG: hypothetical protein H6625_12970 [Bdellovibrionaceae bacterium]|nr:hypothetical protein [Pseudobdellovibrionaceae bacterium]